MCPIYLRFYAWLDIMNRIVFFCFCQNIYKISILGKIFIIKENILSWHYF